MESKELDEYLEKTFANVNSWVNFAEAKNAANIALVVAAIAGIFSFGNMNIVLYIICILFVFSGMASLIAFIPRLGQIIQKKGLFEKLKRKKKLKKNKEDNLLFFEVIKEFSGKEYIEQIKKVYFKNAGIKVSRYQEDLAKEIVYNSDVASRKYKCFRVAAWFDLIAFIFLALALIVA